MKKVYESNIPFLTAIFCKYFGLHNVIVLCLLCLRNTVGNFLLLISEVLSTLSNVFQNCWVSGTFLQEQVLVTFRVLWTWTFVCWDVVVLWELTSFFEAWHFRQVEKNIMESNSKLVLLFHYSLSGKSSFAYFFLFVVNVVSLSVNRGGLYNVHLLRR